MGDPTLPQISFTVPATWSAPLRFELEIDDEDGLVDYARFDVGRATSPVIVAISTMGRISIVALIIVLACSAVLVLRRREAAGTPRCR
jgi:hypothetical protein